MSDGVNYLQTFNAAESKPELLEYTLIGRRDLIDKLEQSVIESATSGNKMQQLIIGPRGSGKTHLLKVFHNRISSRADLAGKLEIAYLCEDEYGVATFLDWLIRIFRSFIRWNPGRAGYLNDEVEKLKKVPAADQERIAAKVLVNYIEGKTLLILVENIGNIFDENKGFGKTGQQKFRDLMQQYPWFTIIATNQALFEAVQKEDKPFHNFFQIIHLKKLTLNEAVLFLKTIAEWDKNSDLLAFLDTPQGKGKIQAIYELVGGNHRLLVTFYQFLKTDYLDDLSQSFLKTVNDLIPYYQSMMNLLSAQQQKIIQYLCQVRIPSNVKNITENCFDIPNSISKQMINLERLKYVDANNSGRETFYELSEPLLRICNEIKENRGGPIKLFVDFLGNLYSAEEIKQKYMYYHIMSKVSAEQKVRDFSQEQSYYRETIQKYFPQAFESAELYEFQQGGKDQQIKIYIEELERADSDCYWLYFDIVTCRLGLNQITEALTQLKQALEVANKNKLVDELIQSFEENLTITFISASPGNIAVFLNETLVLIEEYHYTEQFYKSIPNTIFETLKQHQKIDIGRFEFIERYLNDKFSGIEAMIIPLKFLNIGIRHLKKQEKNVLFQLTKEERLTFSKFVLVSTSKSPSG
jgi:hypothetical protein